MDTWLIKEEWIKRYTPIGDFVDIKIILPFLKISEEIDVRSIVGELLYNRLKQGTEDSDLTTDEMILLDLIRPYLAYATVARSVPFISVQIRGAGVVKVLNANIQPATLQEVKDIETKCTNISDYYAQRILEYLCNNSSKFPLYNQPGNPSADSGTRYSGGFYFGCSCTGKCSCW